MPQRFASPSGTASQEARRHGTVAIAPGIEVPRYIGPSAINFDGKPDGVTVWLTVRCADAVSAHRVDVRGDAEAVTGELLRAIPVAGAVRGLVWRSLLRTTRTKGGKLRYEPYSLPDLTTADSLDDVATVYRVAAYVGDAPRAAVQQALGTSKATADRRIKAARDAGLLDDVDAPLGRGGSI